MTASQVRHALQVSADELVTDLTLVLVEVRDGKLGERSRCVVVAVDENNETVTLSNGYAAQASAFTENTHTHFYVPATRWACWLNGGER